MKFIDFESYTFDGTEIDYQKKMSVPFLLLINAGISFKLNPVLSCISSGNSADRYYQDVYYYENRYTRTRSSRSSCEPSSSSSNNKQYKNKTKPKLIKNGKTPVGYK